MKIAISNFKAALPKYSALAIPESHAQTAADCRLESGDIVPLLDNSEAVPLAAALSTGYGTFSTGAVDMVGAVI